MGKTGVNGAFVRDNFQLSIYTHAVVPKLTQIRPRYPIDKIPFQAEKAFGGRAGGGGGGVGHGYPGTVAGSVALFPVHALFLTFSVLLQNIWKGPVAREK